MEDKQVLECITVKINKFKRQLEKLQQIKPQQITATEYLYGIQVIIEEKQRQTEINTLQTVIAELEDMLSLRGED